MSADEIFELWGKVLKGDKQATALFLDEYIKAFPDNGYMLQYKDARVLHMMYHHLYNKARKK